MVNKAEVDIGFHTRDVPAISETLIKYEPNNMCNGCGADNPSFAVSLRTGYKAVVQLSWCHKCASEVAAYMGHATGRE